MPDESLLKDYARYRLERAREDLDAAQLLFSHERYRIANNRAYYSIFHALRAVLAFDRFDSSKHSGVISEFRRRYIKEGVFPAELSKMIGAAFMLRNASDYDDLFLVSWSDTEEQLANAACVYEAVRQYLEKKLTE
ncbi:MAG: HEPN domain-containing protein [Oscillospiraceae bacterium]|nr:HEPN domain-containing protein [Oscillospiraceae bacterium]